jgi:hypothetical protein
MNKMIFTDKLMSVLQPTGRDATFPEERKNPSGVIGGQYFIIKTKNNRGNKGLQPLV